MAIISGSILAIGKVTPNVNKTNSIKLINKNNYDAIDLTS